MIKVFVSDNHPVVRAGVVKFLSSECDIEVCGEAGTEIETIGGVCRAPCDVVLLDDSMPGRGVIEIMRRIKGIVPHIRILVFSMYPPEHNALRMLKGGASGYLTKDANPEVMLMALREAACGHRFFTHDIVDMMIECLITSDQSPMHQELSDREFEIFCRLSRGKSVSEIGVEMSLSHKTISTYRRRILLKMGMSRNAELTHYSLRNNLIQ